MIEAYDVRHFERLGSTMDEARRLAAEAAPSGTVVHADEQVAGRGRHRERVWLSPPGNLYLSVVLRTGLLPARTPELGFVTAIAVCETLEVLLPKGRNISLKWPNDVLVEGGKIAGILVEQAEAAVILGIGLNILLAPTLSAYPTASIVAQGGIAAVDGARDILLDRFRRLFNLWQAEGFEPIRMRWLARSVPLGAPIRIKTLGEPLDGLFGGLDSGGALLLDTEAGRRRILAGEVVGST